MKNLFIILFTSFIFSAAVNDEYALNVAENFYYFKKNPESNTFSYDSIQMFDVENTNLALRWAEIAGGEYVILVVGASAAVATYAVTNALLVPSLYFTYTRPKWL